MANNQTSYTHIIQGFWRQNVCQCCLDCSKQTFSKYSLPLIGWFKVE